MALLKSFFCESENIRVELHGNRYMAPDHSFEVIVDEIHFKQNDNSVVFSGWRFKDWEALDGIQSGIKYMEKETVQSWEDFTVWSDDEQDYGVQLVYDGEGYMLVHVYDVHRKWGKDEYKNRQHITVKFTNLDNVKMLLDDARHYIQTDGYDSDEESSSEEEVSSESDSEDIFRKDHVFQLAFDPVPFPSCSDFEFDQKNKVTIWMDFYRRRNVVFLQQKTKKHGESKQDRFMFMPFGSFQNLIRKVTLFFHTQTWDDDNEITVRKDNGKTFYEVTLERNKENETALELKAVRTNPKDGEKKTVSQIDIKHVKQFFECITAVK